MAQNKILREAFYKATGRDSYESHLSDKISALKFEVLDNTIVVIYRFRGSVIDSRLPLISFVREYMTCSSVVFNVIIKEVTEHFIKPGPSKLKVWESNRIKYAYLSTNYYKGGGPLSTSCMRGKSNQKALNFYVKNKVKIVVLVTENNKIKARALLWEGVSELGSKKKHTYLDRVYFSEENQQKIFNEFADKNKYLRFSKGGGRNLYIKDISLENITHLPYTDTFRLLYYTDKVLVTYDTKLLGLNRNNVIELTHIGNHYGYFPQLDKNSVKEEFTGDYISKNDSVFLKRYDGWVHKDNIVKIDKVYYSKNGYELHCLDRDKNDYCLKENVVEEVFSGDKIDKTKAIYIEGYSGFVHKKNFVQVKGKQYSSKDKEIVCYKDEYYLISHCYYSRFQERYIPKNVAVIAYLLGFLKHTNRFIFEDTLFGYDRVAKSKSGFIDTEYDDEIVRLIGPYYVDDSIDCFVLNTGEYVMRDPPPVTYTSEEKERASYLIKNVSMFKGVIRRNKKYYLRSLHKFKDKKQLTFGFMKG